MITYRRFDRMTWPVPDTSMADVAWRLRYGEGKLSLEDRVSAAITIEAYMQMVRDPVKKRQRVVSELRKGPNV